MSAPLIGAVLAFALNFFAAQNTSPAPWLRFVIRRLLEFCRTVPDIVFALIFVIAFGLGPMAGVLAIAIHSTGALGKLFSEIVENIDMKPVEGVRVDRRKLAVLHALCRVAAGAAGFVSYALLRFEINVRGASVMGFVGAGGIGQELVVAIRKFYYSDVSAILLTDHRHRVHHRYRHRLAARPPARQGSARMSQLPTPDAERSRAKYPDVFDRPASARLATPAMIVGCARAFSCSGWSISIFAGANCSPGLQPARLDHA